MISLDCVIGHIPTLGTGLELACSGGLCGEYHLKEMNVIYI